MTTVPTRLSYHQKTKIYPYMKKLFLSLMCLASIAVFAQKEKVPVWKNPSVNQQNRLARHAHYFAFESQELAAKGDKAESSRYLSMEGKWRFLFVKEVYTPGQQKVQEKTTVRQIFTMLKKNPYVWDVGIVAGSVQFIMGLGSAQYYFKFIVGDIGQYSKLQAMTILMLVFLFAFPKMIRKMSVGRVVILCSAVGIAGYIVNFFAGSSMAMLMVAFIVTGISSLPGAYLQAPMLMECSSYNEMLGLPRMDSTSAAVMNFMIKFMNALGAGLMGLLLQASGFIATKSGEVVTQPGSAMLMIRILYSIVPAAALFVVILAAKHFDGLGKKLKENGKQ